ncbi:MAG: hypothetical protein ACREJ1_07975, partial [Candidatus Methylomirabilales bacterium]
MLGWAKAPEKSARYGTTVHEVHQGYMERALTLASRGRGRTSPNPMVGAVLVCNHTIIGEGFHAALG